MVVGVFINVPTLLRALGNNYGKIRINFGAYEEAFPSKDVSTIFGTSAKDGYFVDVWIVKAVVYEYA